MERRCFHCQKVIAEGEPAGGVVTTQGVRTTCGSFDCFRATLKGADRERALSTLDAHERKGAPPEVN